MYLFERFFVVVHNCVKYYSEIACFYHVYNYDNFTVVRLHIFITYLCCLCEFLYECH